MTPSSLGLFETIPRDHLGFGVGGAFDARRVSALLHLSKADVSKLASVSVKSVRYDAAMPAQMRQRLEEVANTINMVAHAFSGDTGMAMAWFRARNPLLGDVSPTDMIRLGRYERLRKFILSEMAARGAASSPTRPATPDR